MLHSSIVGSIRMTPSPANSSGYFEIIFTRVNEVAPDLEFRERYEWRPPSVEVVVNFAANEAVERARQDETGLPGAMLTALSATSGWRNPIRALVGRGP